MAIIQRFGRPALPIREGTYGEPPGSLSVDQHKALIEHRETIERAITCVGRIEIDGHPYITWAGAGTLVAPYLFLTARHVASLFCRGQGTHVTLNSDTKAFLTAGGSTGSRGEFRLPVKEVRFLHPHFDVALCELGPAEEAEVALPIGLQMAAQAPTPVEGRRVAIVGFAASEPRNDPDDTKRIFGDPVQERLYLMPGEVMPPELARGQSDSVPHDCSTVGGSAGAPLVDLETGQVLGIHWGGVYGEVNHATPSWLLARDPRVRASGIQFTDDPDWLHLWTAADIAAKGDGPASSAPLAMFASEPEPIDVRPDPQIRYFTQRELYQIRDLLTVTGLASSDRQHLLFISMNTAFIETLPRDEAPDARLLSALNRLNQTPRLATGELPMETLLLNAAENSKLFPQSQSFDQFYRRITSGG